MTTAALLTAPAPGSARPRRFPVPVAGPPVAGHPDAALAGTGHLSPGQGVLELVLPADGREVSPPVEPPEVRAWCARYVHVLVEVLAGRRAPQQLLRWSAPDVYAALARRAALRARLRERTGERVVARPARVRTVLACRPAPGVVEVAAVVHDGSAVRACALRVEEVRGRWRVSVLELG